ncbi:MAG: T9SS type A sorting domain-containing protein [Bacteroidia bacterium]
MKKIITGIIAFCGFTAGTLSAHVITVSNNTVNAGQFTSLQKATNAAIAGDTIYIIGSPTNYGTDTIKTPRLTIIGAGYNVTGTQFNYSTVVNYIYFRGQVNSTRIQGLYINNSIQQVVTSVEIDSVDVERCYVGNSSSGVYVYGKYWTIRNNDINNVYIQNNADVYVQNNFLEDIETSNQATVYVDHNIFATYSGNALYGTISNTQVTNNVFYYSNPENGTGSTFDNNITSYGSAINLNTFAGNTDSKNIFATPPGWTDAAIPASTINPNQVWNYTWTFAPTSHAHDSATDGSDIGIYGGSYPMPNLTGVPALPQITYMDIPTIAVHGGNLNMDFNAQGKMAHGVVSGEYFFDTDPGEGIGNPISFSTSTDSVTVNQSISISSLSSGFHVIGVRVKDSAGHWSFYQAMPFYIDGPSTPEGSIISAEYFYDKDPGQGKGTAFTFTKSDSVNITRNFSTTGLAPGYHNLFVRTRDSAGSWSLYMGSNFYVSPASLVGIQPASPIVAAEYFYDKDPGQGKGTAIALTKGDSVNITASLSTNGLAPGYHNVFIRTKDSVGSWSLYYGSNFYIAPATIVGIHPASPIVAAEYFYDIDPGQGKGNAIAVTKGDSVNITKNLSIAGLAVGYHNLFIRTKDSTGSWSLYMGDNFYVSPPVPSAHSASPIVAAEYFYDVDPGQGKGTAIAVTKADSVNITQKLSTAGLSTGFHNLFVRTKDSAGSWSLYAGSNFYVAPPAPPIYHASPIVAAEFFYDNDPGQGKGTPIPGISSADSINITTSISAASLAIGPHNAFIRVEDSTGHWSLYNGVGFSVEVCTDTVAAAATKDSCFGGSEGTATAFASGGNPPYTYSWSSNPVQTTVTATGLTAGVYTITVTDSVGCPAKTTVVVGQPSEIKIKSTVVNTTCGQDNGSASVTASGGTGSSYKYSWSTVPVQTSSSASGLSPGSYTVTVTDKNNCSVSDVVTIGATSTPSISVVSVIPSECGKHIGSISVSTSGGTAPYRYSWNNGDTLSTADSLISGNYIVTVTDKSGCSTYVSAAVTNTNGPVIGIKTIGQAKCYGQPSGAISTSVTGGAPPYSYLWSTGATTPNVSNLYAGPYYVTVTDASGCSGIQAFTISQPAAAVSITTSTTSSACSIPTGTAKVVATGGTAPYYYNWSSGETTDTADGLFAGAYTVTVTDTNGCIDSTQVAVSSLNGPVVSIVSTSPSTCSTGKGTGTVIISVTGGTGSYTYLWSNESSSTTQNIDSVATGTYNVQVTDAVGCVGTAAANVLEIPPPPISICMVTVDPASNHNFVIWDKSTSTGIASYNIYKETTVPGLFNKIGNVPSDSLCTYVDLPSDPEVQSWRYEISQVDSCGFESPLSPPHKTMHLTINQGVGNVFNLIWDNYEGLPFNYYIVYRDSIPGIATDSVGYVVNNGTYTFTNTVWTLGHSWYYHMGINNPGGCTPAIEGVNYNSSKSNTGNYTFVNVGIASVNGDLSSLAVYPNPTRGTVNFTLDLANTQNIELKLYNTLGQVMLTTNYGRISGHISKQIDLSGLSKGVYIMEVTGENGNAYKKVVLQ